MKMAQTTQNVPTTSIIIQHLLLHYHLLEYQTQPI